VDPTILFLFVFDFEVEIKKAFGDL